MGGEALAAQQQSPDGAAAAAVVTLGAAALYRRAHGYVGWTTFLVGAGALSTRLLVDVLFLLHDHILPEYANIPQKGVLLGLALLAGAFVALFYRQILVTAFASLALAAVFFAGSIIVDQAFTTSEFQVTILGDTLLAQNLVEDGLKLLGIVSWCGYLLVVSWRLMTAPAPAREPAVAVATERLRPDLAAAERSQARSEA